MPELDWKRAAMRVLTIVLIVGSLAACTRLWGPRYNPYTGEDIYPRKFCGILFDCSHEEHYEPGGDPEDKEPSGGYPYP